MYIETERLIIRNMELVDEKAHLEMVSDGSLDEDIFGGYSGEYHEWIPDYIKETIRLNEKDNPQEHYNGLELTANVRTRNAASCKVIEKAGFVLKETKMYQDFFDKKEELYNFYELN